LIYDIFLTKKPLMVGMSYRVGVSRWSLLPNLRLNFAPLTVIIIFFYIILPAVIPIEFQNEFLCVFNFDS